MKNKTAFKVLNRTNLWECVAMSGQVLPGTMSTKIAAGSPRSKKALGEGEERNALQRCSLESVP